jgi:hypothetical protein
MQISRINSHRMQGFLQDVCLTPSRCLSNSFKMFVPPLPDVCPTSSRCLSHLFNMFVPHFQDVFPASSICLSHLFKMFVPRHPDVCPTSSRCLSPLFKMFVPPLPDVFPTSSICLSTSSIFLSMFIIWEGACVRGLEFRSWKQYYYGGLWKTFRNLYLKGRRPSQSESYPTKEGIQNYGT